MDTVSMLNKMSFYCQPILPLVYDESMSYYETLCKVVGQLNTTGETVNKLNEGLTGEIADRQAADAALDARIKEIEKTNKKIHFLKVDTVGHLLTDNVTREKLSQWVQDGDIIAMLYAPDEQENSWAVATNYRCLGARGAETMQLSFYVPISIAHNAGKSGSDVAQEVIVISLPVGELTNQWVIRSITTTIPATNADGFVNLMASVGDDGAVTCDVEPGAIVEALRNYFRSTNQFAVAVNARLNYDGKQYHSSAATVKADTSGAGNIRIAFENYFDGVRAENGVGQMNVETIFLVGDVETNVWSVETIDHKSFDFPRYDGFQFTRGAHNVITTDDESTPNAVYTQYHANESGKLYQNLPTRLIDTVDNTEYWNGVFDIKDGNHMTFTFVTSNYATASDKMLVRVIELSANRNTTEWKYAEKEFELPITGSFTVDDALSDTSTNPVQNKVVTAALNGKASTAVASRTANGLMSTSDYIKLLGIEDGATNTVVDAELNANSTNPVQNKAVKTALDGKASTEVASQTANGLMSAEDKVKLDGIEDGATRVIVDDAMSSTSTNPVQNKAVKKYIDDHNFLPEPIPNGNAVQALIVDRASRAYKLMPFDNLELPNAAESTNAPQSRSVKYLLDRKASKDAATEESDGLMSAVDKTKLDGIEDGANRTVVDASLDDNSTNPVQNKAVKTALDGKAGTAVATSSSNGLMSKDDKTKLDGIEDGATKTTVDAALDAASENPVQNKAVKAALDGKLSTRGGEISGHLRVGLTVSAEGSVSVGRTSSDTGIHFEKAASDAGRISHGSDPMTGVSPIARLKVAAPTEDDDAATKAYVDGMAAGTGAVRYDAAQTLEAAQQLQARQNINAAGVVMPQFQGFLTLTPANAPLGTGVGLSPSGSGNDFTLDISDVNEGTPTLLTGVKTPTDAYTNAAATVEYVKSKVASGGSADAVLYTAQTLTDEQKKQARDNIDAAIADFLVNATQNSGGTLTLDKTFTQIREAALEGKSVLMRADVGGSYSYIPLLNVSAGSCVFVVSVGEEDSIALQTVSVTSDNVVTLSISRALAYYSDGTIPQATMETNPISPMQIATKKYVDDHLGGAPITIKLGTGNAATSTATFAEIKAALEAGKAPILDSAPGTSHWFALNWTLSGSGSLSIQYGTFNVEGGGMANFTLYNVSVSSTGITYSSSQFTTE